MPGDGWMCPFDARPQPEVSVTGMQSAEKPFQTAKLI
jgi:hypothetical protein